MPIKLTLACNDSYLQAHITKINKSLKELNKIFHEKGATIIDETHYQKRVAS